MRTIRLLIGLMIGLGLTGGSGWADDAAPARIGRVSALAGSVQYHSAAADWSDALVNEPVGAGTGLRSARGAEAELRGAGMHVALAPAGELRVLRFDREAVQIAVLDGRIGVHLDEASAAKTVEIDLPRGGVWLDAPGDYDIAAGDSHAPARIVVFSGKAQLGGGLDDTHLAAASPDTFSDWWRSQGGDAETADIRHLSPDIAGAGVLDADGRWDHDAQYGDVWYPSGIAGDWAPYRDGVWRFLPPWGWTWIDNAAWGFAPSHYGRWARIDEHWAWVPGPQGDDPDYSPAAIAFLGTEGIGLSRPGDAGAAVAWFPLAPGEAMGDGGEANYRNRRFATAVPRAVFAGGRPVAAALIDLPEQRLADAPVILGPLDIAPAGAGAAAAAQKLPSRIVVAAAMPNLARPVGLAAVFLARIHEALTQAARKKLPPASVSAASIALRSHSAPSTSTAHSTHNRPRLAAARGGTQYR